MLYFYPQQNQSAKTQFDEKSPKAILYKLAYFKSAENNLGTQILDEIYSPSPDWKAIENLAHNQFGNSFSSFQWQIKHNRQICFSQSRLEHCQSLDYQTILNTVALPI